MYAFVQTSSLTQKVNYSTKGKAKCSDGATPETVQHSSLQCSCRLERLAVQMMIANNDQMMANKVYRQYYLLITKPKFFCQVQSKQQGQGEIIEVVTSIDGIYDVQIPAKMNGEGPAIARSKQDSEYVNVTKPTYVPRRSLQTLQALVGLFQRPGEGTLHNTLIAPGHLSLSKSMHMARPNHFV